MKEKKLFGAAIAALLSLSGIAGANAQTTGRVAHSPASLQKMPATEAVVLSYRMEQRNNLRAKADGKAIITLDIQNDWGDGSGYQMLLDSNHNTYGVQIPSSIGSLFSQNGGADASVYAEFEYKMPENANGNLEETSWYTGIQKQSIEINPGTYDYVICVPQPSLNRTVIVWLGSGGTVGDGVGNDVVFEAGIEYIFTISRMGSFNESCIMSTRFPVDLAVEGLVSPVEKIDMENEAVTVTFTNQGQQEISSFEASYSVNGGEPVTETVNRAIASGESFDYTFTQAFSPEKYGIHEIAVEAVLPEDDDPSDNRKSFSLTNGCDLSVEQIVEPEDGREMNMQEVTVRIRNNGKTAIDSIPASYTHNHINTVSQIFTERLEPGQANDYTFDEPAQFLSYGNHFFEAVVSHPYDLNPENNTFETTVENAFSTPNDPLFFCSFDDTLQRLGDWTVINANGDERTWFYALDEDENMWWYGGAHARINASLEQASDDYLVTRNPIGMEPGKHYVRFNYNAVSPYYEENLRLLYGTSPDPEQMTVLAERTGFVASPDAYYTESIDLDIAQAGDYYFAFHACSERSRIGIKLDNILIDTGTNKGAPNLKIEKVLLPLSGCGMDHESIGVRVSNDGLETIYRFTLSYSADGNAPVEETFNDTLAGGFSKDVYFKTLADLSAIGKHVVSVEGSVPARSGQQPESYLRDNSGADSLLHQSPAAIPFSTDFRQAADRENWHFRNQGWSYDIDPDLIQDPEYQNAIAAEEKEPLISRCVEMTEGVSYRFTYEYRAGINGGMAGIVPEDFDIFCGPAGTPVEEWTLLRAYRDHYTYEESYVEDISFTCPASGQYSIAIVPITAYNTVLFKTFLVEEAPANDLRMIAFQHNTPYRIPAGQLDYDFSARFSVQNKGYLPAADAHVEIVGGETVLAETDLEIGEIEDTASGQLSFRIEAATGQALPIRAKVSLSGSSQDGNPDDNVLEQPVVVTDSVMGYDQVAEGMYDYWHAIGASSDNRITCGVPFRIFVADTLTALSIGWAELEEDMEIGYGIYRYDPEMLYLESKIYETSCMRGVEAGQIEYPVEPMLLEPGWYMFTVSMEGRYLVADDSRATGVYLVNNNTAYPQEGLGRPAIRAIFGHGAKLYETDASANGFSRPQASGSFSPEEMIAVQVTNHGMEEAIIPVNVSVNGTLLETAKVRLAAYASGEVVFTADLSQPQAEYELVAWTALDGDQNPANDTCRMTVRTGLPADPYKLDFESCSDFSISYLNPQWTMLDGDGNYTYQMDGVDFPYAGTPFAFIVFNPSQTSPAMEPSPAILPYDGERFGAAFSSQTSANNDWLISPKLLLPEQGAKASLAVKTYSAEYGLEEYNILVSTTGNKPDDFTLLQTRTAPVENWQEVVVDLSPYAGQEIHFAIQCISDNHFMFMVDGIEISKPEAAALSREEISGLSLYPNPASTQINIGSHDGTIEEVTICNPAGAVLYRTPRISTRRFVLGTENLDSGIYFARVKTDKGIRVLKFIVK